jgi:CRP/FNR family cyclic AMP-dependent transcriptional regulator
VLFSLGYFEDVPTQVLIPWKSGDELAKAKLKAEAFMAAHIVNNAHNAVPVDKTFCDLSAAVADVLEQESITTTYPTGAVLFAEGQATRGVFIVRRGRVKLSICGSDGRTLILRMVDAGWPMGVAAVISGRPYEATAETQEPSELSFVRHNDLLRLMRAHGELALWVTQHISMDYSATCREIRDLILSDSASEKFARLLVGWLDQNAEAGNPSQVKMGLTHEEIGQMIGTSRETVSRLFAGFKKQHLIQQNGSTLVIPNRVALESLIPA